MAQKILIIEDEDGIIHLLNLYLRDAGFDVLVAKDGADGLALHARAKPDLVIWISCCPRSMALRSAGVYVPGRKRLFSCLQHVATRMTVLRDWI